MEPDFWLKKWAANEIGFHQTEVHPLLIAHWPAECAPGTRVLVPLCGKSNDLEWLVARDLEVVGFELSERAVQAYFDERAIVPALTQVGGFRRYCASGVTIFCGDFFAATAALCAPCAAYFDRAALIALAPAQRARYVATVQGLVESAACGLLITVEYPVECVTPPPFSIEPSAVNLLYGHAWHLRPCARQTADVKGFSGIEAGYLLTRRGEGGS